MSRDLLVLAQYSPSTSKGSSSGSSSSSKSLKMEDVVHNESEGVKKSKKQTDDQTCLGDLGVSVSIKHLGTESPGIIHGKPSKSKTRVKIEGIIEGDHAGDDSDDDDHRGKKHNDNEEEGGEEQGEEEAEEEEDSDSGIYSTRISRRNRKKSQWEREEEEMEMNDRAKSKQSKGAGKKGGRGGRGKGKGKGDDGNETDEDEVVKKRNEDDSIVLSVHNDKGSPAPMDSKNNNLNKNIDHIDDNDTTTNNGEILSDNFMDFVAPCHVCFTNDQQEDTLLQCQGCGMITHAACYGITSIGPVAQFDNTTTGYHDHTTTPSSSSSASSSSSSSSVYHTPSTISRQGSKLVRSTSLSMTRQPSLSSSSSTSSIYSPTFNVPEQWRTWRCTPCKLYTITTKEHSIAQPSDDLLTGSRSSSKAGRSGNRHGAQKGNGSNSGVGDEGEIYDGREATFEECMHIIKSVKYDSGSLVVDLEGGDSKGSGSSKKGKRGRGRGKGSGAGKSKSGKTSARQETNETSSSSGHGVDGGGKGKESEGEEGRDVGDDSETEDDHGIGPNNERGGRHGSTHDKPAVTRVISNPDMVVEATSAWPKGRVFHVRVSVARANIKCCLCPNLDDQAFKPTTDGRYVVVLFYITLHMYIYICIFLSHLFHWLIILSKYYC